MITHVVMFKFKAANKEANIEEATARLRAMVGRVPALGQLEVGRNVVPSERAFDLTLIARLADRAALTAYADDPFHGEVKKFLAGVVEATHVVDFADDVA